MIESLVPTVDISYRNGIRYLQHNGKEIRVPMKVCILTNARGAVEFTYTGRNKRYSKKTSVPANVLPTLYEFMARIIREDEIYEHNIKLHMLHYHPVPDKPQFYRASGNAVYIYTADHPSRMYIGNADNPDHVASGIELARLYRQDVLDTQWTAPPPITAIQEAV